MYDCSARCKSHEEKCIRAMLQEKLTSPKLKLQIDGLLKEKNGPHFYLCNVEDQPRCSLNDLSGFPGLCLWRGEGYVTLWSSSFVLILGHRVVNGAMVLEVMPEPMILYFC